MLEDPLLILDGDEGWGLPAGDDDAGQLLHVYSTVQYSTVQYSTVQYRTVQYLNVLRVRDHSLHPVTGNHHHHQTLALELSTNSREVEVSLQALPLLKAPTCAFTIKNLFR